MNDIQKEMFKSSVPFFLQLKNGIIFSELTGVHSRKVHFLKMLENHGLLTRKQDVKDLRRSPIMLTKKGRALQVMLQAAFLEMKSIDKKPKGKVKQKCKMKKKERTRK